MPIRIATKRNLCHSLQLILCCYFPFHHPLFHPLSQPLCHVCLWCSSGADLSEHITETLLVQFLWQTPASCTQFNSCQMLTESFIKRFDFFFVQIFTSRVCAKDMRMFLSLCYSSISRRMICLQHNLSMFSLVCFTVSH